MEKNRGFYEYVDLRAQAVLHMLQRDLAHPNSLNLVVTAPEGADITEATASFCVFGESIGGSPEQYKHRDVLALWGVECLTQNRSQQLPVLSSKLADPIGLFSCSLLWSIQLRSSRTC